MKNIILLSIIVFIYYKINQVYFFSYNTSFYFYSFVCLCVILIYLLNYQRTFIFKMANNVQNANSIQLHELVPDYTNSDKKNSIKYTLADKQLLRCKACLNPIDLTYIDHYKLSYIVPLNMGGTNNTSNLCMICPNCYNKLHL